MQGIDDTRELTKDFTLPSDQQASGRTLGDHEIDLVTQAIRSGTLTSTKGTFVKGFEAAYAERLGMTYAHASTSGTAAMHVAIAALDPEPGQEVITTAITDMGALSPILYQGAIPVFADVDPRSYTITAATIEERITDRTVAIVSTPLFGNPVGTADIAALAADRGIPFIEDCSQAFGARDGGRHVGTFGDIGFFSLQQGKHITTGEGGVNVTNDPDLSTRMRTFINKAWDYESPTPDHTYLAMNYRMSELVGAVALAQLDQLDESIRIRIENAQLLDELLADVPGVEGPIVAPGTVHSYWRYPLHVDGEEVPGGPDALGRALGEFGVAAAPRYIKKPAFACGVFQDQRTFGNSRWPFSLASDDAVDYSRDRYTGTWAALSAVLVLPWNERYTRDDVADIGARIAAAVAELRGER